MRRAYAGALAPTALSETPSHARRYRRVLVAIWVVLAGAAVALVALGPVEPTAEGITAALRSPGAWGWVVFGGWLCLRGVLLLPSTPMLLAGAVAFADATWAAVAVAVVGVVVSAWLVYVLADRIGLGAYLEHRFPDKLDTFRDRLDSRGGAVGVALWAGNPFVPTSLVCYVAGLAHADVRHYLLGVTVGELPLVVLYLVGGAGLASRFLPV